MRKKLCGVSNLGNNNNNIILFRSEWRARQFRQFSIIAILEIRPLAALLRILKKKLKFVIFTYDPRKFIGQSYV